MKTMCCDYSLELPQRDGSNDETQNMFLWRNMVNYLKIISVNPLIQSTAYICLIFLKCFMDLEGLMVGQIL